MKIFITGCCGSLESYRLRRGGSQLRNTRRSVTQPAVRTRLGEGAESYRLS